MLDTHYIRDLESAKLLTDPFKLRLLEEFARGPVTTKQVADRMGEKAPRLYRHVDALYDAGLLTLVEEKPKRGTVERYFRTVAARFEMDPDLFTASEDAKHELLDMVRSVMRDTESELLTCFGSYGATLPDRDELPLVMKVNIRGSRAEIKALRDRLEEWLADCKAVSTAAGDDADELAYGGLLAFYPREQHDDGENEND